LSKFGTSVLQISAALALTLLLVVSPSLSSAQQKQSAAKDSKPAATDKNPAQIELLETKYRFEANGDSRKEVHTRVRINNELGARQFARLNFDFNRSFQSVEIPFVRVTHASGGTADILPSAITDNPNPAVVDYPAYHHVRVKSVRILGLQPDDLLEYRVITTTTHHPLAPDFWLDHTFDRSGVVSHEIFELEVPRSTFGPSGADLPDNPLHLSPSGLSQFNESDFRHSFLIEPTSVEGSGTGNSRTTSLKWSVKGNLKPSNSSQPDISVTTYITARRLSERVTDIFFSNSDKLADAKQEISKLFRREDSRDVRIHKIYDFISTKIRSVDIPLGSTGFVTRKPADVIATGYASPEDKFALLHAICISTRSCAPKFLLVAVRTPSSPSEMNPDLFDRIVASEKYEKTTVLLDPSIEVAPLGLLPAALRGKPALSLYSPSPDVVMVPAQNFEHLSYEPPFAEKQNVWVNAALATDGTLSAKVKYSLRGENELTLRVAFHKTEKEKWKEVAQMLALSDGFRGRIENVTASDPYATSEPFTVEYEISQPKFVDWSKKTVRIPAILPLPGLPDAPTAAQIEAKKSIELGTPLAIDLEATVGLPAGATAQAPIGTTVNRDYATFSSKYSVQGNVLHASRSLHFLSSQLSAARATDLNAFLHAVQSDQSQLFTVQSPTQK